MKKTPIGRHRKKHLWSLKSEYKHNKLTQLKSTNDEQLCLLNVQKWNETIKNMNDNDILIYNKKIDKIFKTSSNSVLFKKNITNKG